MNNNFVHLHLHTEYSLLDGACRIDRLADRLISLGQNAAAITDHGVMCGCVDFYKEFRKKGLKPIIGCEVYTSPRTRFDKQSGIDSEYGHLVLLAENKEGYSNLIKLVSLAWQEGFYIKPRVDMELLNKYSKGLICLSACLAGDIPSLILKGETDKARDKAKEFSQIFGKDNFYLELQNHGLSEQAVVNDGLIKISKELSLPVVCTNDAHYLEKKDAYSQNVLLCIQTARTVQEGSKMGFETDEFYVKSTEEMNELFGSCGDAIENTVKIAERCDFDFEFGKLHLPAYTTEDRRDHFDILSELVDKGLKERYGIVTDEINERAQFEKKTIAEMGYVDYFLIVSDFVNYAKNQGIPVGPGRGSAAGSIVAYCLKITDVDPIKYGLLFERFLNPERITMPDIDIDFCYERRQEVIDYVTRKYGSDNVCQIVTFGTMKARLVIRDVARALGVSYATADTAAKLIPFEKDMTIDAALSENGKLKEMYDRDPQVKTMLDTARSLEGMPRHASTHAAGVIITEKPVSDYVPLLKNDDAPVTQFPMGTIEELGLLKMDFLGLRNLTVINDAVKLIKHTDPTFDFDRIDYEDPKVYNLLSMGKTTGVFQLESPGMRQVLMRLKPKRMEDIIAVISLYRPGPMDSIDTYIENSNHPEKIEYKHPLLKDIISVTNGCIVYQEQVMQIVRNLAGYSYGRADLVRRAMSKKKADVMAKEREIFIYGHEESGIDGAVKRGVPENIAIEIFDQMTSFASYAFNKSHAAAYAVLAYRTAYLKRHFPKEFMAALMTSVLERPEKISEYIDECKSLGIKVLPPDINKSYDSFSCDGDNIRFGLVAIKNVGRGFIRALVAERNLNGPFFSYDDFCKRMYGNELNRRAIEGLIKSGCFDSLGVNRKTLMMSYESVLDDISSGKHNNIEGQLNLFETAGSKLEYSYTNVDEYTKSELLLLEKEATGLYFSGHPLLSYSDQAKRLNSVPINQIVSSFLNNDGIYEDGAFIRISGIIESVERKNVKSGKMGFLILEDTTGTIEALAFPNVFTRYENMLYPQRAISVWGTISAREEENPKILINSITLLEKNKQDNEKRLCVVVDSLSGPKYNVLRDILKTYEGENPITLKVIDEKKIYRGNKIKVDLKGRLISELNMLLGEKNVYFE